MTLPTKPAVTGSLVGTPAGLITIRVPEAGANGMPVYFTLPQVVVSVAPPARTLRGWKEIVAFSVEHGGPSTDDQLRHLAITEHCPIDGVGGSEVVADALMLQLYLGHRRVHLSRRPLKKRLAKKRKPGPKRDRVR
jgi:hypothetical protein